MLQLETFVQDQARVTERGGGITIRLGDAVKELQEGGRLPHTFGVPPPPHVSGEVHDPQVKVPPQPSEIEPQFLPRAAHVVGVQAPPPHAPPQLEAVYGPLGLFKTQELPLQE